MSEIATSSLPTTIGNPWFETLRTWVDVAADSTTIAQVQESQPVARQLADLIAGEHPEIAAQLVSPSRHQFLQGLRALRQVLQTSDTVTSLSTPSLPVGTLREQVGRFRELVTTKPWLSETVTTAAERARTIAGYVALRLRPGPKKQSDEEHVREHYLYDPECLTGKVELRQRESLPPLSAEGEEVFSETQKEELRRCDQFVACQESIQSGFVNRRWGNAVDEVVVLHQERREDHDQLLSRVKGQGGVPNFQPVADAFWERDEAIRYSADLRSLGISPREFDLLVIRDHYKAQKGADRVTRHDRIEYFIAESALLTDFFSLEYQRIETDLKENGSTSLIRRLSDMKRMAELRDLRFEMERIYLTLAHGEELDEKQEEKLHRIRQEYLKHLEINIELPVFHDVKGLHKKALEAYQRYANQMKAFNLTMNQPIHDYFKRDNQRALKIYGIEEEWQLFRYTNLAHEDLGTRSLDSADQKKLVILLKEFESLKKDYQEKSEQHYEYMARLIQEDPKTRPYPENSMNRNVFIALWKMHDKVKEIRKLKGQRYEDLHLLTFIYKDQARALANPPQGMKALEIIVETVLRMFSDLTHQETGIYDPREIYKLAAAEIMSNQVVRYAKDIVVTGAEPLIKYLGSAFQPETAFVQGGASVYPDGFERLVELNAPLRSVIWDGFHVSQFEFALVLSLSRILGFHFVSILAQKGVLAFPVVGSGLGGPKSHSSLYDQIQRTPVVGTALRWAIQPLIHALTGALELTQHLGAGGYVTRTKDPSRRDEEYFVLEAQAARGNDVNIFSNGTRKIASAWLPPTLNLREHRSAVVMAGTNVDTQFSTGMPVHVSARTRKPLISRTYTSGKIYMEPSMSMPSEEVLLKVQRALAKGNIQGALKELRALEGFVSTYTTFPYQRPGTDRVYVDFGPPVPAESFLNSHELLRLYGCPSDWNGLDEHQKESWLRYQFGARNNNLSRFFEIMGITSAISGAHKKAA